MFDEQEFVLVCRRNDYENGIIGDGLFLVSREEWEDTDDYSVKENTRPKYSGLIFS